MRWRSRRDAETAEHRLRRRHYRQRRQICCARPLRRHARPSPSASPRSIAPQPLDDAFVRAPPRLARCAPAAASSTPRTTTAFRWSTARATSSPASSSTSTAPSPSCASTATPCASGATPVVAAVVDAGRALGITHVSSARAAAAARLLHGGAPPSPVEIRENGVRFAVDVLRGQKTGFFLDQRENRRAIRPFCRRRRRRQPLRLHRRLLRARRARRRPPRHHRRRRRRRAQDAAPTSRSTASTPRATPSTPRTPSPGSSARHASAAATAS